MVDALSLFICLCYFRAKRDCHHYCYWSQAVRIDLPFPAVPGCFTSITAWVFSSPESHLEPGRLCACVFWAVQSSWWDSSLPGSCTICCFYIGPVLSLIPWVNILRLWAPTHTQAAEVISVLLIYRVSCVRSDQWMCLFCVFVRVLQNFPRVTRGPRCRLLFTSTGLSSSLADHRASQRGTTQREVT